VTSPDYTSSPACTAAVGPLSAAATSGDRVQRSGDGHTRILGHCGLQERGGAGSHCHGWVDTFDGQAMPVLASCDPLVESRFSFFGALLVYSAGNPPKNAPSSDPGLKVLVRLNAWDDSS
jgi:hypothetical protein